MFQVEISSSVAALTINRPPVHAMNDAWIASFHETLDDLTERSDWSVLLVRSALKTFSAGADLKHLRENFAKPADFQAEVGRRYQHLLSRIENLACLTIAEIGGGAFGGGLELALACDLRTAAETASMGLPEVGLGLIPGAGVAQRLTALCGRAQASRIILGAERIDGREAGRIGLVQWCVAPEWLAAFLMDLAPRMATNPVHAVAAAKSPF